MDIRFLAWAGYDLVGERDTTVVIIDPPELSVDSIVLPPVMTAEVVEEQE